jgi:hypothetical protein
MNEWIDELISMVSSRLAASYDVSFFMLGMGRSHGGVYVFWFWPVAFVPTFSHKTYNNSF